MENQLKEIIKKLNAISLFHFHYSKRISSQIGLYRGQFPVLDYISQNPGCQQIDIAKELQVSPASIANSLKRLEKSGYIVRDVDINNHRANTISISEKGERSIQKGKHMFDKLDNMEFKNFNAEELNEFKEYINRILYNLCGEKDFNFRRLLEFVNCNYEEDDL